MCRARNTQLTLEIFPEEWLSGEGEKEKGSLPCQRCIRGSQSVLCCQRLKKKIKNKQKNTRGQEEDIRSAMKSFKVSTATTHHK